MFYYRATSLLMIGTRPTVKLLAAAVALVMITGVALPAAAHLCMLAELPHAVAASCCHHSGEEAEQCRDEAPDPAEEMPAPRHDMQVCCLGDRDAAFEEAIRSEVNEGAQLEPTERAAAATELPALPARAPDHATNDRAGSCQTAAGFHILYAVMLN